MMTLTISFSELVVSIVAYFVSILSKNQMFVLVASAKTAAYRDDPVVAPVLSSCDYTSY